MFSQVVYVDRLTCITVTLNNSDVQDWIWPISLLNYFFNFDHFHNSDGFKVLDLKMFYVHCRIVYKKYFCFFTWPLII